MSPIRVDDLIWPPTTDMSSNKITGLKTDKDEGTLAVNVNYMEEHVHIAAITGANKKRCLPVPHGGC